MGIVFGSVISPILGPVVRDLGLVKSRYAMSHARRGSNQPAPVTQETLFYGQTAKDEDDTLELERDRPGRRKSAFRCPSLCDQKHQPARGTHSSRVPPCFTD
ncbi:hypothetical protein BCAR13_810018 [Paraburkholderia caribensis]|nr:hypothetical protein BCAR13_810018 [Paraburkholderia caribensis]